MTVCGHLDVCILSVRAPWHSYDSPNTPRFVDKKKSPTAVHVLTCCCVSFTCLGGNKYAFSLARQHFISQPKPCLCCRFCRIASACALYCSILAGCSSHVNFVLSPARPPWVGWVSDDCVRSSGCVHPFGACTVAFLRLTEHTPLC